MLYEGLLAFNTVYGSYQQRLYKISGKLITLPTTILGPLFLKLHYTSDHSWPKEMTVLSVNFPTNEITSNFTEVLIHAVSHVCFILPHINNEITELFIQLPTLAV